MSTAEDHVLRLEGQRFDAMLHGDIGTLERLLSPQLVYTHSHGGRDSKYVYLNMLRNNHARYDSIDHSAQRVDVVGRAAVITGEMRARVANRELGSRIIDNRTMAVWVNHDGPWQLLAFQATAMPAEPVAADPQ